MNSMTKTLSTLAISSIFAFASFSAQAANPFQMLNGASQIAMSDSPDEKCGTAKCGSGKEAESKCGASKCGATKEESKCGASKCGTGK